VGTNSVIPLIKSLIHRGAALSKGAELTLWKIGARSIPYLIKLLAAPSSTVLDVVIRVLSKYRPSATSAFMTLKENLDKCEPSQRKLPVYIHYKMYYGDDGSGGLSCRSLDALESMGVMAAPAILAVDALCASSSWDLQNHEIYGSAYKVLRSIGPIGKELLAIMHDHGWELSDKGMWCHVESGISFYGDGDF
jgi:hypothetical protein